MDLEKSMIDKYCSPMRKSIKTVPERSYFFKVCSIFWHSFNIFLLEAYYMLGTLLGADDILTDLIFIWICDEKYD